MVQINFAAREINCKIVYYGPGRSGKTTNLEQVHLLSPKKCVGEMVSIATETDRTLFFDFLPLEIGKVAGMQVRFQLYTVPGQVYYNATRKLVLQGVDGVVFVADSQRTMMEENVESLNNLYENLRENGYDPESLPLVLQWNKQDLPDLSSDEELQKTLNPRGVPTSGAVAINGKGVFESLKKIAVLVLDKLNKEYGGKAKEEEASTTGAPVKPASTPPPPRPSAPPPPAPPSDATSKSEAPKAPAPPKPEQPKQTPLPASPRPSAPPPPPPPPKAAPKPSVPQKPKQAAQQANQPAAQSAPSSKKWLWIVIIVAAVGILALLGFILLKSL